MSASLRGHDVVASGGDVEAVRRLRELAVDVVVTDPSTTVAEDLALAAELQSVRPGVRVILLAPATTHEDVVAALRAQVFACFTPPFDYAEVAWMGFAALEAVDWKGGIDVVSGLPYWMMLRASCDCSCGIGPRRFMTEHEQSLCCCEP